MGIAQESGKLRQDGRRLEAVGKVIPERILESDFSESLVAGIKDAYQEMARAVGREWSDVAVGSSATADDLSEASFAGQLETFRNAPGEEALLIACKCCFASAFKDRGISYREEHGFYRPKVAVSVGVQEIMRSDKTGSRVMFSIDTQTGLPKSALINAA